MMAWERQVPHHKWKDELEAEAKAKKALKDAKRDAKNEDHTKKCPFCGHTPVTEAPLHPGLAPDDSGQPVDTYRCSGCKRVYRTGCPGTALLHGDPIFVKADDKSSPFEPQWSNL